MELKAIVETHGGKLTEVSNMNRSTGAVKLNFDSALRSLDDCHLIADNVIFRCIQLDTEHIKTPWK